MENSEPEAAVDGRYDLQTSRSELRGYEFHRKRRSLACAAVPSTERVVFRTRGVSAASLATTNGTPVGQIPTYHRGDLEFCAATKLDTHKVGGEKISCIDPAPDARDQV